MSAKRNWAVCMAASMPSACFWIFFFSSMGKASFFCSPLYDKGGSPERRFTGRGRKGRRLQGQNGVFHNSPGFCATGGSCMQSGVRKHPGTVRKNPSAIPLQNQGRKEPCHAGCQATVSYGAGTAFSGGR